MRKILAIITAAALLSSVFGCAIQNQRRNSQISENATQNMMRCIESTPNGRKADCAQRFYSELLSISDDDYGKLPALRTATAIYALLTKIDRSQISGNEVQQQFMQISNDFQSDLESARMRSVAENRAASMQQQQMFMNAQRLLTPPGSKITCYRLPGSSVTTCY